MADMFAPLVAQLKANPKTIVFTEGNDPRILEAASKLLAEGVLKVVMVGNEAECKAAAAAGNFDISAAEIIDPENYAGFDEMVNTMVELRKGKQSKRYKNAWMSGMGEGLSDSMDRITDYYLRLADRIFPVLEVDAGRPVDLVFSQGVLLADPSKR